MNRKRGDKDWSKYLMILKEDRQGLLIVAILVLLGVVVYLSIELRRYKQDAPLSESTPLFKTDSSALASDHDYQPDYEIEESISAELFPFDPNQADSATLRKLGLSRFVTKNILKYRAKGGYFYEAEDFARLYGLESEQYEQLRPYLRITPKPGRKEYEPRVYIPKESGKFEEVTPMDLNDADTVLLRKIPGIGRFYSSEIIRYRKALGGYYDVNQVKEIKSIPDSVTDYLGLWFYIAPDYSIERLNINRASIERLRAHPYLDFYKAKAIIEYRRKRGAIPSYNALKLLPVFEYTDWNRFERYFKLEE